MATGHRQLATDTISHPAFFTESELTAWGRRIGGSAVAPLVLVLRGDLGAGKTTFARAIARGAGVAGPIPSPTYNLLFRYPAREGLEIVHIDLFRLENEEEVWELGWSELPGDDEVVLIEWPERAEGLLPSSRWEVVLEETPDPGIRRVEVRALGQPPQIPAPGAGA